MTREPWRGSHQCRQLWHPSFLYIEPVWGRRSVFRPAGKPSWSVKYLPSFKPDATKQMKTALISPLAAPNAPGSTYWYLPLLWPTLWALWLAGVSRPDLGNLLIFTWGCVMSGGQVINDYADRHADGAVSAPKTGQFQPGRPPPVRTWPVCGADDSGYGSGLPTTG